MPRSTTLVGLTLAGLLAAGIGAAVWRLAARSATIDARPSRSLFDFSVRDLAGRDVSLDAYRGQVTLIVNVASECGLAGQYPELDALYQRYQPRGFAVLAFPSNDFWQEPLDEGGIRQLCETRGVSYPVFARVHIRGAEQSPVYRFLTATGEAPMWNFAKYLVGRDGRPRAFFGSLVAPDSPDLAAAIERALAESPAATTTAAR